LTYLVRYQGELPVAILAGGLATRMRPATETVPKLLLEVAGEPFFSHQLRLLRAAGIKRVVACIGYLGEMVVEAFGDGSRCGLRIDYSFDGPQLLGTGGALIRARPLLGEAFLVLYGDSYLPIDYRAAERDFLKSGKLGQMTVFENHDRFHKSNVEFSEGRILAYNKQAPNPAMNHIDYGLGALQTAALEAWPDDESIDLASIYQKLVAEDQLAGYEVSQRFYEIGSPDGWRELDALLQSQKPTV